MSILDAIIQGIIQGLTEFLPVSSSGHLALYQQIFGSTEENGLFFSAILHLGTLVAVFIAFRDTIWALIKELGCMLKDIFTGNGGNSYFNDTPVFKNMIAVWEPTLLITFYATFITVLIAVPLGIFTATHRNSPMDYLVTTLSTATTGIQCLIHDIHQQVHAQRDQRHKHDDRLLLRIITSAQRADFALNQLLSVLHELEFPTLSYLHSALSFTSIVLYRSGE